jgi:uncharacterized protein
MWCSIGPMHGRDREDSMSTPQQAMMVVALIAAIATFSSVRTSMAAEGDKDTQRAVSVSATGSVAAEPDVAYVTAGVVAEADTAREAIARNNAAMAKVLAGLKSAGVAAKDLQTTALNVEPRYTQAKDGRPATINGYRVANQVRLTVRDVRKLGDLLDQAITLGANQINRIGFDVANAETIKDEARKQAMANARRRAELYATAAGVKLGPVMRISESVHEMSAEFAPRAMAKSSVPVEAGTRVLEVEVHVTYALQ